MEFIIDGKKNKIKLDPDQLLDILVGEVLAQKKDEFPVMATAFTQMMQQRSTLAQFNIDQLATTSFALGYFYRIFLDKNDVTITSDNEGVQNELDDEGPDEPTSETGSSVSG